MLVSLFCFDKIGVRVKLCYNPNSRSNIICGDYDCCDCYGENKVNQFLWIDFDMILLEFDDKVNICLTMMISVITR